MPEKFDLLCEGTLGYIGRAKEPFTFRYIVDLESMQWCKNSVELTPCAKIHKMVSVDETRYTFRDWERGEPTFYAYVERGSGNSRYYDKRSGLQIEGVRVRAEFTGFPKPKL